MNTVLKFIRNIIRTINLRYFLVFIMTGIVALSIFLNWNHLQFHKKVPQSPSVSSPAHPPIDHAVKDPSNEIITEEEAEENEGEEEEAEENTDDISPWTPLNTALPFHYRNSIVRASQPEIAIIVVGLGIHKATTAKLVSTVKPQVTLAYSPYSPNLKEQLQNASSHGFESLVILPMESQDYPDTDSGPYTVLSAINPVENCQRVKQLSENLPKGTGFIGDHGSRFSLSQKDLEPVLTEIKNHGSFIVIPETTIHSQLHKSCKTTDIPTHQVDISSSAHSSLPNTDHFLKKITRDVQENGKLIVSVPAQPQLIDQLPIWLDKLEKNGIALKKISDFTPIRFDPIEENALKRSPLNPSSLIPSNEAPAKKEGIPKANG